LKLALSKTEIQSGLERRFGSVFNLRDKALAEAMLKPRLNFCF